MAENSHPLAKLITEGHKFISKKFVEFKELYCQQNFDDIQFLIDFEHKAELWEKRVVMVLKTFEKQNYILKFQKPEVKKPTSRVYIAQEANNRIQAQLKILTDILTEIETNDLQPQANKKRIYWIDYTADGKIFLNNTIRLHQTQTNSKNAILFNYLVKNPNVVIKLDEIEKIEDGAGTTADLTHSLKDCGFNEQLKRIFFPNLGTKTIMFRNPVYKSDLIKDNIPPIDLSLVKEK